MKKLSITLILAAAFFVSCNSDSKTNSEDNGNSDNTTTATVATQTVADENATEKYQCPMKCQGDTAYIAAGQCPVCEMDLVKL